MKRTTAILVTTLFTGAALAGDPHSSEVDIYLKQFESADSDNSHTLSSAEAVTAGVTREMFGRLDANGDYVLSLDEFLAVTSPGHSSGTPYRNTQPELEEAE